MKSSNYDTSFRAYTTITRGSVDATQDDPMMQTHDVRLFQNEKLPAVERFQPYGHSSYPKGPDANGQAAECLTMRHGGNSSHPITFAVDDRRYRPKNAKEGDVITYHWTQSMQSFTDDGWTHDAGDQKKPAMWTVGATTVTFSDQNISLKNNNTTVVIENDDVTVTVGSCVFKVTSSQILCGSASASIPVMLQTGPSQRVFADK